MGGQDARRFFGVMPTTRNRLRTLERTGALATATARSKGAREEQVPGLNGTVGPL